MSTNFDPYHRWLGIPPKHQPPDHYRLLAIERFENDAEVIRDAAERQMSHVRRYELGQHSQLAQRILNELARAKACLLDSEAKAAYDEQLRPNDSVVPQASPNDTQVADDDVDEEEDDVALRQLMNALGGDDPRHAREVQKRRSPRRQRPVRPNAAAKSRLAAKPTKLPPPIPAVPAVSRLADPSTDAQLGELFESTRQDFTRKNLRGAPTSAVTVGSDGSERRQGPTLNRWVADNRLIVALSSSGALALFVLVAIFLRASNTQPKNATSGGDTAEPSVQAPPFAIAPFGSAEAARHQAAWAEYFDIPIEFTNSIGMKFRLIPPGQFMMGSPESEKSEAKNPTDEQQHRVRLTKAYYLSIYETTQQHYLNVTGVNPSFHSPQGQGKAAVSGQDTSRFPVESVSWGESVAFTQKLSALAKERENGRVYRLPTEAEWEHACRSGTTTVFHFGNRISTHQMNFRGIYGEFRSGRGPSLNRTTTVGSYAPNAWGFYDMHGNVSEWCQDWHAQYRANDELDPTGPSQGTNRVARGGEYRNWGAFDLRSAKRHLKPPTWKLKEIGFRIVCDVSAFDYHQSADSSRKADAERYQWALAFDGTTSCVVTPHVAFDQLSSFTIEVWVKNWHGYILNQGVVGDPENSIFLSLFSATSGWETGGGRNVDRSLTISEPSLWNHIALLYDGKRQYFYINGRFVGGGDATSPGPLKSDRTLNLGGEKSRADGGKFGHGLIGALRISRVARYSGTAAFAPDRKLAADKDTIVLYDFRQGSGDRLADASGNGRHGIIRNAKWVRSDLIGGT